MSTPRRRKRTTTPVPKKHCSSCKKDKATTFFFKVNSPMFTDGMINICRDCVRSQVDVNDMEKVMSFLRQIDKPFIQSYWNEAVNSKNHPLGEYVRKVNSLSHLKNKTFDDTKGSTDVGRTSDIVNTTSPDSIKSEKGKEIEFSEEFIVKWGTGYKKHEYLKMEKFYIDMYDTHEINTPIHKDMLVQLAKLAVRRNRYLESDSMSDYDKANKAFEVTMKSAGFRPVDRQGLDDATGIRSFSQIWDEVEKRGWRKPPPVVFEEDDVDAMIVSLLNYYHRLVGKQILSEIPDDVRDELDNFFEDDFTPVDIDDDAYEELDFSLEEDEENDD